MVLLVVIVCGVSAVLGVVLFWQARRIGRRFELENDFIIGIRALGFLMIFFPIVVTVWAKLKDIMDY